MSKQRVIVTGVGGLFAKTLPAVLAASLWSIAATGCAVNDVPVDTTDVATTAYVAGADHGTAHAAGNEFTTLLSRAWSLPAGATDIYRCLRVQLDHDTTITGIRALAPFGTHHSVLTISSPDAPVGEYDCTSGVTDQQMVFAAGIGTDELQYPAGVGVVLPAGTKLNLNLHLFNATDSPISGVSGVEITESANVTSVAQLGFIGAWDFSIPNNGQIVNVVGSTTVPMDVTLFDLFPHMHQIATHQKVVLTQGGVDTTLLDEDYSFTSQHNYPLATPLQLHTGDVITTTCSYMNNKDHVVNSGDSSTDEMCITGVYFY